jgi:opacity protein-like surface antigen
MKRTLSKCLILASIVTLSVTSVRANAPKTGAYIGAAVGGAALTGKSNLNINRNVPAFGINVPQNFNLTISDKSIAGDIFLGYGRRFNCFWAAIEALASFASLNSKSFIDITPRIAAGNGQSLAVKTTNAWGATLNLGYYINQATKLYLKLGIETRRFRSNFVGTIPLDDPNILDFNKSYNSTAFVPGLGMEAEITPRFSLRTEYRTALHPVKTIETSNSPTQITNIKTRPTIHYFNIGLIFRI